VTQSAHWRQDLFGERLPFSVKRRIAAEAIERQLAGNLPRVGKRRQRVDSTSSTH
jgi:hypothetical protein